MRCRVLRAAWACLVLIAGRASAQEGVTPPASTGRQEPVLRTIEHQAFATGERLVFDLGYSFITAGEAEFAVARDDTMNGRDVQLITFTVKSTPTFSWIFRVDDRYETWIDTRGLFPWKFTQRIREGKYARDFAATLDQINNVAITTNGRFPIPPYVQDVVSAFYYARTLDYSRMAVGQKTILENFYRDSTYSLAIKFLGRQRVDVDAGSFDCVLVEPLIKEGGLFKADGRILIWLTNDERKIPVKVSTKVVVGSIDAELRSYSGINGPVRAKVK